jgi:hypothetical protein
VAGSAGGAGGDANRRRGRELQPHGAAARAFRPRDGTGACLLARFLVVLETRSSDGRINFVQGKAVWYGQHTELGSHGGLCTRQIGTKHLIVCAIEDQV